MARSLVLFDFDGTLYKKDSLLDFTIFCKGKFYYCFGMILLMPWLIGLKLGVFYNGWVKQRFLNLFYKGMDVADFKRCAEKFALQQIRENLHPRHFKVFLNHIESGHDVFIVTASSPLWIAPWSRKYNVQVIGTTIEVQDGKITGRFSSENCYGTEKVRRIEKVVNLADYDEIFVYGKGRGDREMLDLIRQKPIS